MPGAGAAFALDVQDSQLVTRALQTLLPPALHIQGPLQITGKADGAVSRDAQQPWEARVTGLEASLEASLAQITWRQDAFTNIITKVFLKDGISPSHKSRPGPLAATSFSRAIFPWLRTRRAVGSTGV